MISPENPVNLVDPACPVAPRKKPGHGRQMVLVSIIKKPDHLSPGNPAVFVQDPWLSVSASQQIWLYLVYALSLRVTCLKKLFTAEAQRAQSLLLVLLSVERTESKKQIPLGWLWHVASYGVGTY